MQDIAVIPSVPDPRLNSAECVITGQEKASHFSGLKQLLHGVCWSFLFISLVTSVFVSQRIIVKLKRWANAGKHWSKIAGVMFLSLFIFFAGISLNIYAWTVSTVQQDFYVRVFFGVVLLVLFRRPIFCIYIHCRNARHTRHNRLNLQWDLTSGHGENTSKNIHSCVFLYPAVFIACHHLLWILLGVITEPLWGSTVLVGITSVSSVCYFLVCEFHKAFYSPENSPLSCMFLILMIPGGFLAFVLLMLVLLVVAQAFLGESLISTVVQNGLVAIVTVGFSYLKLSKEGGGG